MCCFKTIAALTALLGAAPAAAFDFSQPFDTAAVRVFNPISAAKLGGGGHAFGPQTTTVSYMPRGAYIPQDTSIGVSSAIGSTDGPYIATAFWVKGNTSSVTNFTSLLNSSVMVGSLATMCEPNAAGSPGICFSFDNSAYKAQFNFNNATGTSASMGVQVIGAPYVFPNGVWTSYVVAIDTVHGACGVAVNGVSAVPGSFTCPATTGVIPNLNNSGGFHLINAPVAGGNATIASGSIAEVWVAEQNLVCRGAGVPWADCAAANTIRPSYLSKFVSGTGPSARPVDLGANCAGPTGVQPELCFYGSGPQFLTNHGNTSGTVPSLAYTRALGSTQTVASSLQPSSYGPGGIPAGQPTLKWVQASNYALGTAFTTNAGGDPIAPGDFLIIVGNLVDSSGSTDHAPTCPSGGSLTWTRISAAVNALGASNGIVCYALVPGGDTTETGAYTVNWTTATTRSVSWALLDYANVSGVGTTNGNVGLVSTTPTSIKTPASTTTANGSTLVSIFTNWNAGAATTWTLPATDEMRFSLRKYSIFGQIIVTDQYAVASGSSTQKTVTMGSNNFAGIGFTLELKQ
jgi:hypothetical protein